MPKIWQDSSYTKDKTGLPSSPSPDSSEILLRRDSAQRLEQIAVKAHKKYQKKKKHYFSRTAKQSPITKIAIEQISICSSTMD